MAGALVAMRTGQRRWRDESDAVLAKLLLREAPPESPFSVDELAALPRPVARFFRSTMRDGQRIITHARITWQGEFNMGQPGKDNWRPFTAVQDFVPGAPGFIWNARITVAPGVPIFVRDSFVDGRGTMRGAVLGLIPVVDVTDTPTLASGALQRYLGEAAWLPTALLPRQGVSWTAVDDTRARATISAGRTTVSLEFEFDDRGRNVSVFAPDRFYDDGTGRPVAQPWHARSLRFREHEGMISATEAIAEWHLPTGTYAYWRGRPLAVEYRYGAPPVNGR
jgi:hypothetical protein